MIQGDTGEYSSATPGAGEAPQSGGSADIGDPKSAIAAFGQGLSTILNRGLS
jgi:hypothetical protein